MRNQLRTILLAAAVVAGAPLHGQIEAGLLRQPDVSASEITFIHAGDIWIAPKAGGRARQLTTMRGSESFPRFSADGSRVAFTDAGGDIHVAAVAGGTVRRLTYHPAPDRALDWTPTGEGVLFMSFREQDRPFITHLYTVGAAGGLPRRLPVPYADVAALSPDGKVVAYTPASPDQRTWKRYQGGRAQGLWLFDLERNSARRLPGGDLSDTQPMWHGHSLYFVSERGAGRRANLWVHDTRTGQSRQVTRFTDFDVRFPAVGPGEIAFENGGRLYLLPLTGGEPREVRVQFDSLPAATRPQPRRVGGSVQSFSVAPAGTHAVIEARGEVFTLGLPGEPVRNLSQRSGSAERFPSWSPDGRTIAYWTDRTGEYELAIRSADGMGEERILTRMGAGFRYLPQWSPDSRQIAFVDQALGIHLLDVTSGRVRRIDRLTYGTNTTLAASRFGWSPDSRWLAYHRGASSGSNDAVHVYDTRSGRVHQLTAGFYGERQPVFDPEGRYLYFLTDRAPQQYNSAYENSYIFANATQIAAVPLRRGGESPLAPRPPQQAQGVAAPPAPDRQDARDAPRAGIPPAAARAGGPVEIDFEGFEARAVILPPRAGNYTGLDAAPGKVLYRRLPRTGADETRTTLAYYDLAAREEKVIVENAAAFALAAGGSTLLVREGNRLALAEVAPGQRLEQSLALDSLQLTVDPPAEWRQIFSEAWRIERDFFYDPGMNGIDWEAMRRRYAPLAERATSREDVNYVIGEMIGELGSSHTSVGGGDVEQPERRPGVGLLGADFVLENGAYRISRILDGAPWDSEVRSPLRRPGVDVREGSYLLAVNGRPVDTTKDPWAAFEGATGAVTLTVNDVASLEGARTVLVETLGNDSRLRTLALTDQLRRRTEAATGGRVGYIYLGDTGPGGRADLVRQLQGQVFRDGLIIDERFNGGGQMPDRMVEMLNRPPTTYWARRSGVDAASPDWAHAGPKVMLMNGWAGSGGDALPYLFRRAQLGPLIGTRTQGALVATTGPAPALVDGGSVSAPSQRIFDPVRGWIIENEGVVPDIEVEADPARLSRGEDPQLERAIREVMRRLQANPPARPTRPAARGGAGPR